MKGGIAIVVFVPWVGGKNKYVSLLLSRFPPRYDTYVEVFGGAGNLLLNKPRPGKRQMEVYNDVNGNLVNLFRMVRERPFGLVNELNGLRLNSREDFFYLRQLLQKQDHTNHYLQAELAAAQETLPPAQFNEIRRELLRTAADHDLRRAADYYQVIRCSYGGGATSFSCQPCNFADFYSSIWQVHRRLRGVVIENQSYDVLIPHYAREGVLFYCDPPYIAAEGCYDSPFTRDDHTRLAEVLHSNPGHFLLSYNDHPLAWKLYEDCSIIQFQRLDNLAQVNHPGQLYSELLIANYDLHNTAAEAQLTLFDWGNQDGEQDQPAQ